MTNDERLAAAQDEISAIAEKFNICLLAVLVSIDDNSNDESFQIAVGKLLMTQTVFPFTKNEEEIEDAPADERYMLLRTLEELADNGSEVIAKANRAYGITFNGLP